MAVAAGRVVGVAGTSELREHRLAHIGVLLTTICMAGLPPLIGTLVLLGILR